MVLRRRGVSSEREVRRVQRRCARPSAPCSVTNPKIHVGDAKNEFAKGTIAVRAFGLLSRMAAAGSDSGMMCGRLFFVRSAGRSIAATLIAEVDRIGHTPFWHSSFHDLGSAKAGYLVCPLTR